MRLAKWFHVSMFSLLVAMLLAPGAVARAASAPDDDSDAADEYDENARVVRISLLGGDVSLRRAGESEWESAAANMPLVEGDEIATSAGSHAELQIDRLNFLRLGSNSSLKIVTLRDEGIALSLASGTASLRLAQFDRDHEYFEVDAPRITMAAEQAGLYRLDVAEDGRVRVTSRGGGQARVYSATSGFTLRDGRSAELIATDDQSGDWNVSAAADLDDWDRWNDERERELASRIRVEDRDRYYDRDVWGAEELDSYGNWTYANDYGWLWQPQVTVINNYNNWAPYRYGHWAWCRPYGWTWIGDEPWGWAPYHYGRWVYYNNYWRWAPRGYVYPHRHNVWRPALVAFVYIPTSYGERVAWYPLGYRERDPRSRNFRGRVSPIGGQVVGGIQRINPAYLRAVTTMPVRDFGHGRRFRGEPATEEIARRAVTGEPVRGRLPIVPARNGGGTAPTTLRDAKSTNPVRTMPAPTGLRERPTGAGLRRPGVALDNELLRNRVFNGREVRPAIVTPPGENGRRDTTTNTGVITRPPIRVVPPSERVRGESERRGTGGNSNSQPATRPARTVPERTQPPVTGAGNQPERIEGKPRREIQPRPMPAENSVTPRPERRERQEPASRPAPAREERPAPPVRQERPAVQERQERAAPRTESPAPRSEPRPASPPAERSAPQTSREREAPSQSKPESKSKP